MMTFRAFIEALSAAVLSANDKVSGENLKLLGSYFDRAGTPLGQEVRDSLEAKTVTIQYPKPTKTGLENVDIEVPLVTLVPVSTTQIKEVKLAVDVQLCIIDDELQLDIVKEKRGLFGRRFSRRKGATVGTLEVSLNAAHPEGLSELISGYEKALRAQIPG